MLKCNHNSKCAFIICKNNTELNNLITIEDYLLNKNLQNEIKNKDKILVCKEKHELIKYESKIKKSHVKNKSPDNFEELKSTIDKIIKHKITKEHLKNYFNYLFTQDNDYINKKS